jgi:hypothetical protein
VGLTAAFLEGEDEEEEVKKATPRSRMHNTPAELAKQRQAGTGVSVSSRNNKRNGSSANVEDQPEQKRRRGIEDSKTQKKPSRRNATPPSEEAAEKAFQDMLNAREEAGETVVRPEPETAGCVPRSSNYRSRNSKHGIDEYTLNRVARTRD